MAFVDLDATKPVATDKVSTTDNLIRQLKADIETNLSEICGYPNNSITKKAVWTTATRPSTNLVDRLSGYNTTLGVEEYYDLATTSWKQYGVQALIDAIVPIGCIMMWSGSTATIPAHWHLCDGNSGTINLCDRFIIGAGTTYAVGAKGGSTTHTLTIAEMPPHAHAYKDIYHMESSGSSSDYYSDVHLKGSGQTDYDNHYGSQIDRTTESAGSGLPFNNLPPYYALAYIQRIS